MNQMFLSMYLLVQVGNALPESSLLANVTFILLRTHGPPEVHFPIALEGILTTTQADTLRSQHQGVELQLHFVADEVADAAQHLLLGIRSIRTLLARRRQ